MSSAPPDALPHRPTPTASPTSRHSEPAGVYGRLLGDRATALHPRVRRLHVQGSSSRAVGTLQVRRGSSPLARVAAILLGLPAAGDAVPTRLTIIRQDAGERWIRHMGTARALTSTQYGTADGVLVECYGPLALQFTLTTEGTGLRLRSHGLRVQIPGLSLPLPSRLAPTIHAEVRPDHRGGVWIAVKITAPLAGLLLHYHGHITVEQPAHA